MFQGHFSFVANGKILHLSKMIVKYWGEIDEINQQNIDNCQSSLMDIWGLLHCSLLFYVYFMYIYEILHNEKYNIYILANTHIFNYKIGKYGGCMHKQIEGIKYECEKLNSVSSRAVKSQIRRYGTTKIYLKASTKLIPRHVKELNLNNIIIKQPE